MLYTCEGGEGSGKTTVMHRVADELEKKGFKVLVTREPGGSAYAEEIRSMIMRFDEMNIITESLLFAAARSDHVQKRILPALEKGYIVLCDRYVDSSYVYQGILHDKLEWVKLINNYATGNLMPAKTFFFDIEPSVALGRIHRGRRIENRFDEREMEFHQRVYEGFCSLLLSERHCRIDANREVDVIAKEITDKIIQMEGNR